jgi:hypothetical protein
MIGVVCDAELVKLTRMGALDMQAPDRGFERRETHQWEPRQAELGRVGAFKKPVEE